MENSETRSSVVWEDGVLISRVGSTELRITKDSITLTVQGADTVITAH